MSEELNAPAAGNASQRLEWQQALDSLEQALHQASLAVAMLRRASADQPSTVGAVAPPPVAAAAPVAQAQAAGAETPAPVEAAVADAAGDGEPVESSIIGGHPEPDAVATFDRLWRRLEHEKLEKHPEMAAEAPADGDKKGKLPQHYLMTVEDREGKVDLVPLHRSLTSIPGMEEVSLVTYANGVPVVSLRTEGDLDLDQLGDAVSTAMDRECEVIPQDRGRIYLRLKAS